MKKEKLNVKSVGATSSRPHFEGKAKEQNGITLIALIITIIVMLILVGVTVATISDGGLFQKAKTAAEKTEEQAIYEQLVGAIDFETNGKIKVKETYSAAKTALEAQGKTVALTSPSTAEEIENEATIKVNGHTYTITTEEIKAGELKFYGYGYRVEAGEDFAYYYFLKNGLAITEVNNEVRADGRYELQGNKIIVNDNEAVFSSDYTTITFVIYEGFELVGSRDNNKIFKNIGTQDPTYKLYVGSAYCTKDASDWFNVGMEYENDTVSIYKDGTDLRYNGIESFINDGGAEISPDGKTVIYNNQTYYLLER